MAATVRSIEKRLLKNGTVAGPVTQKMIDRSKEMYNQFSDSKKDKWGWLDFLAMARQEETNLTVASSNGKMSS